MRIDIITVLPEMIEGFFNCSIMKRAQNKGLAEIYIHNLRDYTEDKYRRVDDYPFGGFAGMVMKIEPIERCINALKAERDYDEVIFTTPDGEQFDQKMANTLSLAGNLIILCGHSRTLYNERSQYRRLCADWWRIGSGGNGGCYREDYSRSHFRRTVCTFRFFSGQFIGSSGIYPSGRIQWMESTRYPSVRS